jgi:hypothetical protein
MSWEVALFAGSSILSAANTMQQASAQAQMYKLQALQTQAEYERKALQYSQRANETLKKVRAANSAVVARNYAGGVKGLEGSAALIRQVNEKEGGVEFMRDIDNARDSITFGNIQANILRESASIAKRSGTMSALGDLAMGGVSIAKTGFWKTASSSGGGLFGTAPASGGLKVELG